MLTHANFIFNLQACKSLIDVSDADVLLSFLPLSHVFERLGGHYVPLSSGAKVAYAESTFTVAQNMREVAPTVMLSVPRLYETMHDRILRAVQEGSPLKQKIFQWGVSVGASVSSAIQNGKKPSPILQLQQNIADKLVFAKLKAATGGAVTLLRLRWCSVTTIDRRVFPRRGDTDFRGIRLNGDLTRY